MVSLHDNNVWAQAYNTFFLKLDPCTLLSIAPYLSINFGIHAFHINCILSQKETETEIAYFGRPIAMSDLFRAIDGMST